MSFLSANNSQPHIGGQLFVLKSRMTFVLVIMLLGFTLYAVSLVRLQVFEHGHYQQLASSQRRIVEELPSDRGRIVDRNGVVLADNVDRIGVYVLKNQLKDPRDAALKLSKVLNIGYDVLLADLNEDKDFIWLARNLPRDLKDDINKLAIAGVNVADDPVRVYPQGRLASHVLGGVGGDDKGLFGLEASYEYYLSGLPGRTVGEGDALGREVYSKEDASVTPQHGCTLELTLDLWCQYVAEDALRQQVVRSNAHGGMAVVMDCQTGAILALVSLPDFDPNHWHDSPRDSWRPHTVTDAFEPGSCMKPFIIAHALEKGLITTDELFDARQPLMVADRKIVDVAKHPDYLTASQIIRYSSNCGVSQIGLKIGSTEVAKALAQFGFGSKCGLELGGETAGRLPTQKVWGDVTTAFSCFGYGLSASPVQLARAMAVLANGGYLVKPHLIQRVLGADGSVIVDNETKYERNSVLDSKTAAIVRQMLIDGVEEGNASQARVKGYAVGGKTGTTQKVSDEKEGYNNSSFRANFVGFAPARNPRIVVVVSVDEPQGQYYGNQVAAPVFSNICTRILPYLNVEPDGVNALTPPNVVAQMPVETPTLIGMNLSNALDLVQKAGGTMRVDGSGGRVVYQNPLPGMKMSDGDIVEVKLSGDAHVMPNLVGQPPNQALATLLALGIKPQLSGDGRVAYQSLAPGTEVKPGAVCKITLQ
jgi:cell division protein FtsI/penicillin-binding protein 2